MAKQTRQLSPVERARAKNAPVKKHFTLFGPGFLEDSDHYTKVDALIALGIFIYAMFVFYFEGRITVDERLAGFKFITKISTFFRICIPIAVVLILRRQGPATVGLRWQGMGKSLLLGLAFSVLPIAQAIIKSAIDHTQLSGPDIFRAFLLNFLVEVSFTEELLFRAYLQTRLRGLIKNPYICAILSGVLFMFIHIPFQVAVGDIGLFAFIAQRWLYLLNTFILHMLFSFVYVKYNNIAGSVVYHFFVNHTTIWFL